MAGSKTMTFEGFGNLGVKQIGQDVAALDVEMHKAVHAELALELVAETPIDEQQMLKSWGSTVNGSPSSLKAGGMPTSSALQKIRQPGMFSAVVNNAAHALVIDMAVPGHSSPQAPQGVSKPAMTTVESRLNDIRSKVIAKVSAR